jgi:hypothetical protein
MGEVKIFSWLGLKFCETALTAKKERLSVMLTGIFRAGGVHLHATDRVQDEMLFPARAMRARNGNILKFIVCFITHKFSLAVIPTLHKKTAKMQPTILADL